MTSDAGGIRERAEQRLAILARQLERVGVAGLIVVTDAHPPGRDTLRRSAELAIARAGLAAVLADGRAGFRAWVEQALNQTRSDMKVIQYALGPALGPVQDRVDLLMAVDDAVLGSVGHEVLMEETRRDLLEPFERMMGGRISPRPDQHEDGVADGRDD